MTRRRLARRRGTTVVEFALVLPIFITLLFLLFEYGRGQMAAHLLANACRDAARLGATDGVSSDEAAEHVRQIMASMIDPAGLEIQVKNLGSYDDGAEIPSGTDFDSLPALELSDAETGQLFALQAKIDYSRISLFPSQVSAGYEIVGIAYMRHE